MKIYCPDDPGQPVMEGRLFRIKVFFANSFCFPDDNVVT
jgi:hypothetical protein